MNAKTIKMGVFSFGNIVIVLVIVVFVNLIIRELPSKYIYLDMTTKKLYGISKETEEIVKGLQEDIQIYVIASEDELYETDYSMDYNTYSYNMETTGYDGEGQLTSAIDYVTSDDMLKIYTLKGHGEMDLFLVLPSFSRILQTI